MAPARFIMVGNLNETPVRRASFFFVTVRSRGLEAAAGAEWVEALGSADAVIRVDFANDRSYYFAMSKGTDTRNRIVETALRAASVDGIEGISLGKVAADVGMSKSGLFAHFDSKEALQVDVIASAAEKFTEVVVAPALSAPRGEPRLRALFERWLAWEQHESLPGGCIFMHAAAELDDRPGPARDMLVSKQLEWLAALTRAVRMTVEAGHFRSDVDPRLFAFQLYGIVLSYYHAARLFRDPDARSHVVGAFESLVASAHA